MKFFGVDSMEKAKEYFDINRLIETASLEVKEEGFESYRNKHKRTLKTELENMDVSFYDKNNKKIG